jgi:hypothetical protein
VPIAFPPEDVVRQLNAEYERLKLNPKPERKVTDKDALKLFRDIRKLRPEDFGKALIARCGDGDIVVLCNNGLVRRISHETMEDIEGWDTAAQFFHEALSDE